ncbi:tripartite tricarboxylate transporter substrate binding protein [Rubrivivax gelatinosus]|uniref:Tripartite-type tricarboxylate transporter receptor subunit TctC n=1 Tax=Rubrivivax gelatinosus (strain NBRC 100245 / IL144) TaxID=983917 RepID=I0HM73_RUBGI|nr:tripartite tricarboxylate transporter substrate binding protein [Rubrivivax gelatinosus]BAL94110.1 hypothetical protein RGE_07670 [Rubrivivax gelatinosus IL144]
MKLPIPRRTLLAAAATFALPPVFAQGRALRFVIGFPAGGSSDAMGRALAERLAPALKQPLVVENRDGGGGTTAAAMVAKAPADGSTLMLASSHHLVAQQVQRGLPYDFATAFEPVAAMAAVPSVLVVSARSKLASVKDLIAAAGATRLRYGSVGAGSTQQATAELFRIRAGIKLDGVAFAGGNAMMNGLANGEIDLAFETIPSALAQLRAGRVKALAVSTAKRSFALPELPTLAEAGLSNFDAPVWYGVVAPAGTPRATVERLNETINRLLDSGEFKAQLLQLGATPVTMSPLEWAGAIRLDLKRWERLARQANLVA